VVFSHGACAPTDRIVTCVHEFHHSRVLLLILVYFSMCSQMTAHRAFQFCLQYKRTTEFRRLCEILRNHLTNLNKYRDQRDRPDLTQPESLQLYLETRFEQLKIATELELWQVRFFGKKFLSDALMCLNCAETIRIT